LQEQTKGKNNVFNTLSCGQLQMFSVFLFVAVCVCVGVCVCVLHCGAEDEEEMKQRSVSFPVHPYSLIMQVILDRAVFIC